jgi:integrase
MMKIENLTFDELIAEYFKFHSHKKTIDRDECALQRLKPFFSGKRIVEIKKIDVLTYRLNRKAAVATINKEVGLLNIAINWYNDAHETNLPNPAKGTRKPENNERSRWLTEQEYEQLLFSAGQEPKVKHYLPAFVEIAVHTGMRKGEIMGLTWTELDLNQKVIYLSPRRTKNSKKRTIPLNQHAQSALLQLLEWQRQNDINSHYVFAKKTGERIGDLDKSFNTAVRRAQLKDVHIHDLRRTCASWLVQRSVPITEVAALLGHSDIEMTYKRYAHLNLNDMDRVVKKLEKACE